MTNKLVISAKGGRQLITNKPQCHICKNNIDTEGGMTQAYFNDGDKKIYCKRCVNNGYGAEGYTNYWYMVDKLEVEQ